jgi:GT2 family glycosyltransferase
VSKNPRVTAVVLNYNGEKIISACVDSLLKSSYKNLDVVIFDNGSTDKSLTLLKKKYGKNNRVTLRHTAQNLHFCGGFNEASKYARGEKILLVSNDVVVDTRCVEELVNCSRSSKYIVTPKILSGKKRARILAAGNTYTFFGFGFGVGRNKRDLGQYDHDGITDFANATVFLIDRKFFVQLKGYDSWYQSHYEDVDLCNRARKNKGVIWYCHKAVVYHKESYTLKRTERIEETLINIRKNRLMAILKNYNGVALALRVTGLLSVYLFLMVTDLFYLKKPVTFSALGKVYQRLSDLKSK